MSPSPSATTFRRGFGSRRPSPNPLKHSSHLFGSSMFPTKPLAFKSGPPEIIVLGGRSRFNLVGNAFSNAGIKQIHVYGWGSQGPAQAQNLRDTLESIGRSDIKVCVGLRANSANIPNAKAAGFTYETGTLGDPFKLASESDMTICLASDGGMVESHKQLFAALKPGAIIGISHGFIVAHLESVKESIPEGHDLIMVAPKGMGPSVRKLYVLGAKKEGAGINSSVAFRPRSPDRYGLVQEVANAWAIAIGSPVVFGTDFMHEVTSDLFGERNMLLGGLWGTTMALYDYYIGKGYSKERAFRAAVSGLTGTVTKLLSELGMKGFYESLTASQKLAFDSGYTIGYPVHDAIMDEVYQDVSSLREIKKVIEATERLKQHPMSKIEVDEPIWAYAEAHQLYGEFPAMDDDIAFSAGVYVSGIMAQLHTLLHHGHKVSEVINESFIEAIDSLTPYMHAKGLAFMVDNCSTTARLGTRLWGPVFKNDLTSALKLASPGLVNAAILMTFADQALHDDVALCMAHRPTVRIDLASLA
jgi:ketol-acid reductoisomerase